MDQGTLGKIAAILNAGSTNYSVFLKLYEVQLGSQIIQLQLFRWCWGQELCWAE